MWKHLSGVYVSQSYVFFSGTYLTVENTPAWCSGISLSHVAFGGTHLTVGNTPCGIEVHHCLMIFFFAKCVDLQKMLLLGTQVSQCLVFFSSSAEYVYLWETLLPGV